jgi:hypothetical protein
MYVRPKGSKAELEVGAGWLTVEWLAAYAPELNPRRSVWGQTK